MINRVKLILIFCVSIQIINGMDSIVVLQNGLNGYNGCKDTYIQLGGYQTPHFLTDSILVGDYYCTT